MAEMLRGDGDVIVTTGIRETRAARQASSTIPIVMLLVPDPVAQGFAESLSRPGGNVTGLTSMVPGLSQKYVELLHDTLPAAKGLAVIAAPPNPAPEMRAEIDAAARRLGIAVQYLEFRVPGELDAMLALAKRGGAAGIVVPRST